MAGGDDSGLAESNCKLLHSCPVSEHLLQLTGIKRTETYHLPLYSASACQNSVCFVCCKSWGSGCPLQCCLRPPSIALLLAFCSFVGSRLYKACPWKAEAAKRFKANLFGDKEGIEENLRERLQGFCSATEPCLCKTQPASKFQQAAEKQAKKRLSKTPFPSSEVCHLDRGWLEGSWNI